MGFLTNIKSKKIIQAAREEDFGKITSLFENGADPNYQDATGKTALSYCCEACNIEAIKTLIDHKANPNIEDNKGITPFHHVCFENFNGRMMNHKRLFEILLCNN